jgi:hypothetical protein
LGNGGVGWQTNLPVSKQFGDVYIHANGGFTHLPAFDVGPREVSLFIPHAAASAILRVRPMFHLMFETLVVWDESIEDEVRVRDTVTTLSPGFRTGWNIGDAQAIVGFAVPVQLADGPTQTGVFGYFSYELAFLKRR